MAQNTFSLKKFSLADLKPENVFLFLAIIFGLCFVFYNPPFQANDEDRHFYYAYQISTLQLFSEANKTENKVGCYLPKNLVEVVTSFQGIPFQAKQKVSEQYLNDRSSIELNSSNKIFYNHFHSQTRQLAFFPHAIGIMIGRILGAGPVSLGYWGRLFGLAFYIFIVYYVIKLVPIFKSAFILYALSPMALFQASSVTYDTVSNALGLLIVALCLYYAFDKEAYLDNKSFYYLLGLMLLHGIAKQGYLFIPFMFFIIPKNKINVSFGYIPTLAINFIYCTLLFKGIDTVWFSILPDYSAIKEPPFQNDFEFSKSVNFDYWIGNFDGLISNLSANFAMFRQEWLGGVFGRFGYSYTMMPNAFYFFFGLGALAISFLDNREDIEMSLWQKGIIFTLMFLNAFALIFTFLLTSPVGAKMIFGFQGRYLVQLLPLVFLLMYQNKIVISDWNKYKYISVAVFIVFTLLYAVTWMQERFFTI
jgi:uncharacterized membrane protein